MDLVTLKELFKNHKESTLFGRYIFSEHILPLLRKHQEIFSMEVIGSSVLGEEIHAIKIGNGPKRIMMWSQMHGNESTTTKAVFDLCNTFADSDKKRIKNILMECTIAIIPMLNPDGAKVYKRVNANEIDLNRDAQNRSQPESKALRWYFENFRPHFCFNLHGQRTIFSSGHSNHPATISFLAPSQDEACTVTLTRKKAMEIIVKMNTSLQQQIPNQVGIYDDTFNINCVGDMFQSLNVPTVLFEAGHFANDYNRELVREFIFQSLLVAIHSIAFETISGMDHHLYASIPQNQKLFYDVVIRNSLKNGEVCDVAIQYQEKLINQKLEFVPIVEKISDLNEFYGHKEMDANGRKVLTSNGDEIYEGYENDLVFLDNELFSLKV